MEELDPDRSGTISFEEFRDSWQNRTGNSASDESTANTVARGSREAAKRQGGQTVQTSKLGKSALNSSTRAPDR